MKRRRYLVGMGGGIGGLVAASAGGSGDPHVRILETNDPVDGGDDLTVTAAFENGSSREADLEFLVGGEAVSSRHTSSGPGAETVTFHHRTYPVRRDVEFLIALEIDGRSVERTVEVRGIDELDEAHARPARDLAVRPDTTVMFEVDDRYPDGGEIHWFVDGEWEPRGAPIWESAYRAAVGADYWRETFDSDGSSEVAVAVVADNRPNRTTRWDVTVDPDGAEPPTIDAARPESSTVPVGEGDTRRFELDVSAPDGDLERVVWWMDQADQVLGVSDVSGEADTATLEYDGGCHTCGVHAWVRTETGALAEEIPWTFDDGASDGGDDPGTGAGEYTVSILETTAPVDAGEFLSVTAAVENEGSETVTAEVDLVVGDEVVDSSSVSVDPGGRETTALGYETYPVRRDVEFPVRVETADDADERIVTVYGTGATGS